MKLSGLRHNTQIEGFLSGTFAVIKSNCFYLRFIVWLKKETNDPRVVYSFASCSVFESQCAIYL